ATMNDETRTTSELGKVYEAVGMPADTNTMGVLALVAGIAGWVAIPVAGAVVAIVLGHLARHQIARSGGSGGAIALGGLVLGYSQVALAVTVFAALVVLTAVDA